MCNEIKHEIQQINTRKTKSEKTPDWSIGRDLSRRPRKG
ncbi:unnamed protein product [Mycetohabitans rhizoxinica HKI 454]|uniref:Uncharacterized protein n=1 Tax=Mycetohabitans rhizoxinica (strain DSM 19002 / CIP 109453 / HKI 454) TaxID=882378 RepID=E5AN00_MYCRK|nr:unnamed protein product [Mycetohabitans rhizoxinica HKI 454]